MGIYGDRCEHIKDRKKYMNRLNFFENIVNGYKYIGLMGINHIGLDLLLIIRNI
jgi:hypothetical protein